MTYCANRDPEQTGDACSPCKCGADVRDDVERAETRVARVPDSARDEGAA